MGTDRFLYKYASAYGENASFAAVQAELHDSASHKLPALHRAGALYTKRSLEQCSSEQTAHYKASLFAGKRLLSLASGLGVDDISFSGQFHEVVSVDPDRFLNQIARYNFNLLGIHNVNRVDATAEEFLNTCTTKFDLVYADPDRRSGSERQILLKDHMPNMCALAETLFKFTDQILIKCSPLYDYHMAVKEFPGIRHIYSISKQGEMKEMLILSEKYPAEGNGVGITCADLQADGSVLEYTIQESDKPCIELTKEIDGFLFEAGASLVKMRKHHHYAGSLGFKKMDESVAFYIGGAPLEKAMGKFYKIIHTMPYKAGAVKQYLTDHKIRKANIKARGMKFKTADMALKLEVIDGGNDFLFALPLHGKALMIHAIQLNS